MESTFCSNLREHFKSATNWLRKDNPGGRANHRSTVQNRLSHNTRALSIEWMQYRHSPLSECNTDTLHRVNTIPTLSIEWMLVHSLLFYLVSNTLPLYHLFLLNFSFACRVSTIIPVHPPKPGQSDQGILLSESTINISGFWTTIQAKLIFYDIYRPKN